MDSPDESARRDDYISWEELFMGVAVLAAQRSKDPVTQVGACIVNSQKRIVGVGYNSMPYRCSDYGWGKHNKSSLDNKHLYVCHAELNAIASKNSADLQNCTMYVTLHPCNECAKLIIQSGISKVVYMSDKHADKTSTCASKRMLCSAFVKTMQYKSEKKIVLDFNM